jgi:hypothetical protein
MEDFRVSYVASSFAAVRAEPPFVISSEPRIFYCAAPEMATCAAFIEESRMKFADHQARQEIREAEGSAVSFLHPRRKARISGHPASENLVQATQAICSAEVDPRST